MRLVELNLHPVKSTAIRPVTKARVGQAGLVGDREWMVVDAAGQMVSARELSALFHVVADCPATGAEVALRLSAPGVEPLELDLPEGPDEEFSLFGKTPVVGRRVGAAADDWLTAAVGRDDLHLVWASDPSRRPLTSSSAKPGEFTAYADGWPITVLNLASLAQLNRWIEQEAAQRGEQPAVIPVERFRANLVVDGAEAFAEEVWNHLEIGGVRLRVAKPVWRCVMTTIDPASLARGKEPIRTLARHKRSAKGSGVEFCMHLAPEALGTIAVGDEVRAG